MKYSQLISILILILLVLGIVEGKERRLRFSIDDYLSIDAGEGNIGGPDDEEAFDDGGGDGGGGSDEGGPAPAADPDNEGNDEDRDTVKNKKENAKADVVPRGTRNFQNCKCAQKIRTSYVKKSKCGQAALCFWEIYNYVQIDIKYSGRPTDNKTLDELACFKFQIQDMVCAIGYPKPLEENPSCLKSLKYCDDLLADLLKQGCEILRKKRPGMRGPEDVVLRTRTEDFNYDLSYDEKKHFAAFPSSNEVKYNNFYEITCPVVYRYPYFTIDLLLKDKDPNIEYDETMGIREVVEMLPKYVRLGVDTERKINFHALSIDENEINWCEIPNNYICVKEDRDVLGDLCKYERMEEEREKCMMHGVGPELTRGIPLASLEVLGGPTQ